MKNNFLVDFKDTPFLKTSITGAKMERLNWRCEVLLTRNIDAIKNKKVLDLASHDGRFSYACLKLGAKHVTGIEAREHLVKNANDNMVETGCKKFKFIKGDVFDHISKINEKEYDTIICLGFFYHTLRQLELLKEIKRIKPKYIILDTNIAEEICRSRIKKTISLVKQFRLKNLMNIPKFIDEQKRRESIEFKAALMIRSENHMNEKSTIDPINLVAWPTKSFIELSLNKSGFDFKEISWNKKEIKKELYLEDYKGKRRVSFIAKPKY
jgi:16S rRNA G966 N2-methylase RsmD